jgi:hypothetical protein
MRKDVQTQSSNIPLGSEALCGVDAQANMFCEVPEGTLIRCSTRTASSYRPARRAEPTENITH